MHNFYSVKFDRPIKEGEKLSVLFPISLGQAYHYDDKFAAVIDFIQKNCQKAKFIPVLQTHAKQMWITNISNASAVKGARRDRNKWLKETKEIRKNLTVEVEPRLPETSYEKLVLEEDDRCWEYWLKVSKDEIASVRQLININLLFTELLTAASEAYTDNIINKIRLNHRNFILNKGDKEVFLHKARQAIIDELGVMLKWQQVFSKDYDFIAYPISQSNIQSVETEKKGISALVVDCFNALFDKKTDIKLPVIDIQIYNPDLTKEQQKNSKRLIRRHSESSMKNPESGVKFLHGRRKSKSLPPYLRNEQINCSPEVTSDDTFSDNSNISSRSTSTNISLTSTPSTPLSRSPENPSKIHLPVAASLDSTSINNDVAVSLKSSYRTGIDHINSVEADSEISMELLFDRIVQEVSNTDDIKRISRLAAFTRFLMKPQTESMLPGMTNTTSELTAKITNNTNYHNSI